MAIMQYSIALVIINIVILFFLLLIYLKNLKSIKSKFTSGLIIFALIFLIQNLVAAYFYLTMMDYYAQGTDLLVFVLTLMQTIAFAVFLAITWE